MTEHPERNAELEAAAARWRQSRPPTTPDSLSATEKGPKSGSSVGRVGPGQVEISRNDGSKPKGPPTPAFLNSLTTMDQNCLVCMKRIEGENWRLELQQHEAQHWLLESEKHRARDEATVSGPYALGKSFELIRKTVEVRAKVRAAKEQEERVWEKLGRLFMSDIERQFLVKHDLSPNQPYADGGFHRAPDPAKTLTPEKPPSVKKALADAADRWMASGGV